MINCGKYTEEIDVFVRTKLKNKIDYLKVAYSGAYPFTFRGCNSPSIKV